MKLPLLTLHVILFFVFGSFFLYAKGGINSGKPVPYIGDNPDSAKFLAKKLKKEFGGEEGDWMGAARNLAATLSQLDAVEQNEIWHGP